MPLQLAHRRNAALRTTSAVALAIAAGVACSPTYDWRQLSWPGGIEVLMPCKPDRLERQLPLAGAEVRARMMVCDAGGLTWSATAFELRDAAAQDAALQALEGHLADNLGGGAAALDGELPYRPAGLDVAPRARRMHGRGRRPGGTAVQAEAAFAAYQRWAVQLVVLAPGDTGTTAAQRAAIEQFLGGLRRAGVAGGAAPR